MDPKPVVYTTPTCPYCKALKAYLAENNVEFDERDVTKDVAVAKEMVEKSGQLGVPQMHVGDRVIVGFDKHLVKKELGLN